MSPARSVRWAGVLATALGLSLLTAAAIWWPVLHHQPYESQPTATGTVPRNLQELVQRGDFGFPDASPEYVKSLLPFDSISLERTPCLGRCPIYQVTFYKDGHATLVTEDWSERRKHHYTSSISILEYARLTQLVDLAKGAARESQYAGAWTDDSGALMRARSRNQTWEVYDYGRVAPVEVWALETLLHSFKENREWTLVSSSPLFDGSRDTAASSGKRADAR